MTGEKTSMDAVAAYLDGFGVRSRPLREILSLLTAGSQPIEVLIVTSATPRRSVEDLLRALGEDVTENSDGFRMKPGLVAGYRSRFSLDELGNTAGAEVAGPGAASPTALAALIAAAPAPRRDLDHVAATAETLARRVSWLHSTYDLAGRRVLFVGDHDLTSVALARACPRTEILVVDIDERTLAYIDETSRAEKLSVRTLFGDLRFTLPAAAREWADLVLTDPPYTPEGVGLFLGRGLAGLRDRVNGVLVVAYGHSRLHPMLGFQVQQSMQQFGVVFEMILPAFNRYDGAQAVGSASDLYVCAPTSRTWKVLDRIVEGHGTRIYTHGRQSVESAAHFDLGAAATTVISEAPAATDTARSASVAAPPVESPAGSPAVRPVPAMDVRRLGLRNLFTGSDYLRDLRPEADVAVDLTADPGPLLLRALLAVTATRVRLAVTEDHLDVVAPAARAQLAGLVAPKYRLSFRPMARATSGAPRGLIVQADLVDADLVTSVDAATSVAPGVPAAQAGHDSVVRWMLERAHGRIGNVLREGVVRSAAQEGRAVSKNEARAYIRSLLAESDQDILELTAMEAPRARLERLVGAVRGGSTR